MTLEIEPSGFHIIGTVLPKPDGRLFVGYEIAWDSFSETEVDMPVHQRIELRSSVLLRESQQANIVKTATQLITIRAEKSS